MIVVMFVVVVDIGRFGGKMVVVVVRVVLVVIVKEEEIDDDENVDAEAEEGLDKD